MKTILLGIGILVSNVCVAEIAVYKSTDNTGINKLERIGVIEQYLATLSATLQKMESKLESNSQKLAEIESSLKGVKDNDIKKIQEQLSEKKPEAKNGANEELEKLKADILAIKNEDIERIRRDIQLLKLK